MKTGMDEESFSVLLAKILLNNYSQLLGQSAQRRMTDLVAQIERGDSACASQLEELVNNYSGLVALFTLRLSADKVENTNPGIAMKLNNIHNEVVRLFETGQHEAGHERMNEGLAIATWYA